MGRNFKGERGCKGGESNGSEGRREKKLWTEGKERALIKTTSMASEKIKKATKRRKSAFTKPAITSALT